ncbi:MAG: helix-turn-helix domain-containing protein [Clostridia bacterium]|nr:MAG: helix-turn-helix domain-containing protein [Clostridia bacterium]
MFDRRDINVYAKTVYIYLCRRADDDSQAFPTYARIAEDVGASQRTVHRAIKALIAAGLLLKEARYDSRGLQTSNLYTLIRPSTVPEQGPKRKLLGNDAAEPLPESPVTSCGGQDRNEPGCSGGTGGVVCDNTPDGLLDQPGWSVGPPGVVSEAIKEYPSEKYPGEEDPSVRPSVHHHLEMPGRKRLTDRRIDFANPQPLIRYYAERFGADARQVVMAMLAVQAQLDKGAVITNH